MSRLSCHQWRLFGYTWRKPEGKSKGNHSCELLSNPKRENSKYIDIRQRLHKLPRANCGEENPDCSLWTSILPTMSPSNGLGIPRQLGELSRQMLPQGNTPRSSLHSAEFSKQEAIHLSLGRTSGSSTGAHILPSSKVWKMDTPSKRGLTSWYENLFELPGKGLLCLSRACAWLLALCRR